MTWKYVCVALCALAVRLSAAPVEWDVATFQKPPRVLAAPASVEVPEGVHAVCFEGPRWRGRETTQVFAYYGVPAGASAERPVPGIVLVHGAGGTAFARWVKLWVDRGYAAIAFDNDAGLPIGKFSDWARNPESGPRRGDIAQIKWPVTDQWMYHAVANTMLAHSLLASLPGVDARGIGVTGVSWGGVIVANTVAIDERLKFAAPVYGCGFIAEESADGSSFVGQKGTPEQRAEWSALWDPAHYLPEAKAPLLWLNGTNDFAFTPHAWQRSYRSAPGERRISLRVRMQHAHGPVSEEAAEVYAFAESRVNGGAPLAQVSAPGGDKNRAWAGVESSKPLVRAEFNFTRNGGRWQDRVWETVPAQIENGRVSAAVPAGAAAYFFNVIDDRGLIVSSEHVVISTETNP